MPRIDPFQLLKCLSVLLGPTGGIKSKEEVHRLANLMTKFSKKLVSKCIYIQILKTTNTELLSQFMDAGGWSLVHMWLTDGIVAKNWALIQELLELLHLCPVKIERLKSNNCPKLIKGLSKEVSHQGVRVLASRLVEQWLKIVKGEAAPNSVPAQIIGSQTNNATLHTEHYTIASTPREEEENEESTTTVKVQDIEATSTNYTIETSEPAQPMQLHILNPPNLPSSPAQHQVQHITKQSYVVVGNGTSVLPSGPVCKITIRDGNHVLVKVETDAANINKAIKTCNDVNGEVAEVEEAPEQPYDAEYEEMTVERLDEEFETPGESASAKQTVPGSKTEIQTTVGKLKESKESVSSIDSGKTSDKENRDSHKTDEKKATISGSGSSSDKKSSSSSSKSSSSKHSSSSHRTSHRSSSSSHRSNSGSSSSSRSSSSKDKSSRHHHSSSSKHSSSSSSSSSKSKSERDKEREKEKLKKDQADKDKATLEKVQAQAISSKLGKIPKKKPEDERPSGDSKRTDSKDNSKENKDKTETRRNLVPGTVLEKKNISISIENRKNSLDSARPKTVKTFNSKFRSTGLEEEVKPPPPRSAAKKSANAILEKKIVPPNKPLNSLKRASPLRETSATTEKRPKLSLDPPADQTEEKKGAIKLISPKPKPMVLQESDMFMDALTASTKNKEPRKRNKRRPSISKDGASDPKKQDLANSEGGHESPQHPSSPQSVDDRSPLTVKPNFKFYQDTLETDEDKEEKEEQSKKIKEENSEEGKVDADGNEDYETNVSNLVKSEMAALAVKAESKDVEDDSEETKTLASPDGEEEACEDFVKSERSLSPQPEIRYVNGLRSVLLAQKRKGPKKILKWKTELESIRYFELDETERVNVTKTFTDMKQMEKQNEREAFQMARKLSNEDLMEEKTMWKPLIPIDLPAPLAEPGKDSREKDIQYAREKGILQALYFNRGMIPDSPAEPDEERHHIMTDPKVIPLDDLTGNKDSEKDFTGVPWPEPKPTLAPPTPVMQTSGYHYPPGGYPHNQPPMMPPMGGPPGPMGPMPPMGPPGPMMAPLNHMGGEMSGGPMSGPPGAGGGGWRTGDGKVVVPDVGMNPMQQPMPNMPGNFPPGMDGPMGPPGMMGPPMFNQQEGFPMMGPDDMGYGNFQGPPGPPGMFGPGPSFPGGPPPRGGGPMHANRGRGSGPGWFRGGVAGGPMGPPRMGGGGGWRGGWRGNGKQPPICRQFTKNGFCRVGDKCQYLHPGVNCPPF